MEADRDSGGGLTVVTGGAGFIGSHLVESLAGRGARVRVLERPGAETGHLPAGVEVAFADIREREGLREAMSGARRVYHLAANPNLWVRDRGEFERVNHRGTRNVLEAALEAGAERVLHVSTESILTREGASAGAIDEDAELSEGDAVGPYCLSKLRAELAARDWARRGAPVLIANPTMPVGPGDRGLSPPSRLIADFLEGRLPAYLECTLNMIDVRDVAEGLRRVMEVGAFERRYLLGGENLRLSDFLGTLSRISGRRAPRLRVPRGLALGVAAASEWWADHVSGRPPKATVTGVRLAFRRMEFDASRSLGELGLRPRPIEDSLRDAVAWFASRGIGTRVGGVRGVG